MKTTLFPALLFSALLATGFAQPAKQVRPEAGPRPLYADNAPVLSLKQLRQVAIANTTIDEVSRHSGNGSTDDAANFVARNPAP